MVIECPPLRLVLLGIVATILSLFNYSFHYTITALPADIVIQFVNNSMSTRYIQDPTAAEIKLVWGSITAAHPGAGLLGAMFAQPAADFLGRKPVLFIWCNIMSMAGCSLMPIARKTNLWELLFAGRIICGFAGGAAVTLLPVYLTECSPIRFRGLLGSMHAPGAYLVGAIGVLLSYHNILGNEMLWGFLFAFPAIPALFQICLTPVVPETPQYDYIYRGNVNDATLTVKRYFGKWAHGDQMEKVFLEYDQQRHMAPKQLGLKDVLISSPLRGAVVLAFIIGASRAFTGEYALTTYSYRVLIGLGMPQSWIPYTTLGMQIGVFLVTIPGCYMVESLGRRPLLLYTLAYIWCSWVIVVILQIMQDYVRGTEWMAWLCVILILTVYVIVYPIGASLITWFIAAELVPQSARAGASAISIIGGGTTVFLTTLFYPLLADISNPLAYSVMFVIPLAMVIPPIWLRLPETKNRTTAEISAEINRRAGRPVGDYFILASNDHTETDSDEAPVRSYEAIESNCN